MGEGLFTGIVDQQIQTVGLAVQPIDEVDAFEFLTSSEFLNEDPFPFQRVAFKHTYNLWEVYPPDAEEAALIKLEEQKWGIKLDLTPNPNANKHVWVLGRRGTKSTTISMFASYELYTLICKGNPQAYYGIREKHPIFVVHMAAAANQAEAVFTLSAANIRRVPFFRPYIDFDKNNSTELRLFSPYDLLINERIKRRNSLIQRGSGQQKEDLQPGTLTIKSVTTTGASNRGDAIKFLIFSELAHVQRAQVLGSSLEDGGSMEGENPRTDYGIVKAMEPSILDFGTDGRIVYESSPVEKGGEFYRKYCVAGGPQQDLKEGEVIHGDPEYKLFQFATWEVRPTVSREDLNSEFQSDPVGAESEYGAKFGNPSGQFISEKVVAAMFLTERPLIRTNPGNWHFIITLDPGGKAKKKVADTYAVGWGHAEGTNPETEMYYIDGLQGFDATVVNNGGTFEKILVDPNMVIRFVMDLVEDLGGRNFVEEICYDQFDSSAPINTLQSHGFPALETFFTNPYKDIMYRTFLQKLEAGRVKCYGVDIGGFLARLRMELKYLQRSVSGQYVYYHHPSSGPVQHDDYADVSSNLIHRLSLRSFPTMQSTKDARRRGSYIPPPTRKGPKIATGPRLFSGGPGKFRR